MRVLLVIYTAVGLLLTGLVAAEEIKRCPNSDIAPAELVTSVAIWPVFVVAVIALQRDFKFKHRPCKEPA